MWELMVCAGLSCEELMSILSLESEQCTDVVPSCGEQFKYLPRPKTEIRNCLQHEAYTAL